MEIRDVDTFNNWILPIVKPICLADPESLARYVVVLLKKNNPKPDLRSYCIQNLTIFIDCSKMKVEDFVDMVLDAVENKKYCSTDDTSKDRRSSTKHSSGSDRHKRTSTKRSPRSRSRSPGRHTSEHSTSRTSGSHRNENRESRKTTTSSRRSRSRSRSDRGGRSRSPHSRLGAVTSTTINADENEESSSKKAASANKEICRSFEQQGYCVDGDLCTYTHPGFLQVEEKDIQAIASTYQAAATVNILQPNSSKPNDFTQQLLNSASPKNAHISPMLASYLQMGFQQIAASVTPPDQNLQQPFMPQPQPDGNPMFNSPFGGPVMPPMMPGMGMGPGNDQMQPVPMVMSGRGFNRSNIRQIRRSADSFGHPRNKFGNGENRFADQRYSLSASQLDSEMDQIVQANANAKARGGNFAGPENPEAAEQAPPPAFEGGAGARGGGGGGFNRPYSRGRGGPRGGFHRGGRMGRGGMRGPVDLGNNSLEIRKVPAHLNVIGSLHEHFSKFGPISNIQVNFESDPEASLVTFSNHNDALNAYRSAQPLFNNRFIRVFWHHKDNQQQQSAGSEQQNSESKPAADVGAAENKEKVVEKPVTPKHPPRAKLRIDHSSDEKAKVTEARNDLAKRRRLLLANYLEMRKSLAEKLEKAADSEKSKIEQTLKTVDEKIAALKAEIMPGYARAEAAAKQRAAGQQPSSQGQPGEGAEGGEGDGANAGTPNAANKPKKPSKTTFIVDRRPKQLLVVTVPGLDAAQLRAHFSLFCSVDNVELSSAGFVITFTSRRDAEMAKARGLLFRGQQIDLTWHQPTFYEAASTAMHSTKNAASGEAQPRDGDNKGTESSSNAKTTEKTLFDDGDSEEDQPPLQQPSIAAVEAS